MRSVIPVLLLALAACATAKKDPPAVAEAPVAAPAAPAPVPQPVIDAAPTCRADADCTSNQLCLSARCVAIDASTSACNAIATHFDFDQSSIRSEDFPSLQRAARCLQALPGTKLRIEGNCDERGTTEYNLALGQRRAVAARKYLVDLGVKEGRTTTVSYGEEKPRCNEHMESCWSENRRDDLVQAK